MESESVQRNFYIRIRCLFFTLKQRGDFVQIFDLFSISLVNTSELKLHRFTRLNLYDNLYIKSKTHFVMSFSYIICI